MRQLQGLYTAAASGRKERHRMNLEDVKNEIEQRTGVPASLLSGETPEENIAQAKALLAYKREHEPQQPKSPREQFSEWFDSQRGIDPQDTAAAELADLEEAVRTEAGGYPYMQDGGEASNMPDPRPASEQFAEWFNKKTAFDPFKDADGWLRML